MSRTSPTAEPGQLRRRALVRAATACLMTSLAVASVEAQERQISVLSFSSTRTDAPAALVSDQVMQRVLADGRPELLDYYAEHVDLSRFPDASYRDATLAYLSVKYARLWFDVIVVNGDAAIDFAARYRAEHFPDTPIVFITSRPPAPLPNATGLVAPLNFADTVAIATRLQPETQRVVVVGGRGTWDAFYEAEARAQFQQFSDRLAFDYLTGLPMPELLRRVAALPPRSILYFLTVTTDGRGHRYIGVEALDDVAKVANAPIYSWHSAGIGRGIVGGSVLSQEKMASATAELALRVLRGAKADSIPVTQFDPNISAFDWRQVRRFGIDERLLPAGSTVLHREPTAWEQYSTYIAGGVSLVVVQGVLITGLLVHRSRRRSVEAVLRESQHHLEASTAEARSLAGRLIVAQEAERARIARDLHDDISQQLAGLSIALSTVKRRLQTDGQDEAHGAVTLLQQRAVDLAESIRDLSHGLHPRALEGADIELSLRAHCNEFRGQADVDVAFVSDGSFAAMSSDAKLCLYRVTQEGLRNITRHAHARRVDVRLMRTSDGAELTIADDGQGFDVGRVTRRAPGLGLRSIRERVRQAGGTVSLLATPGRGTTLRVLVPFDASPADRDASVA